MKRMAFDKRFVSPAGNGLVEGKIHAIRRNYDYWKIFSGREVEMFYWEGKPYRSKQKVFCVKPVRSVVPSAFDGKQFWNASLEGGGWINPSLLARNDGFENVDEFHKWFENYKHPVIMCIIHFTDFRYTVRDTDNLVNKIKMEEKMNVYISGQITGDANYRKKFLDAENRLRGAGYSPVNPAAFVPDAEDWNDAMRTVLRLMLKSGGIALLPDWGESKGAKIEARLAREVGIPVKPIEEWINGKAQVSQT